MHATLLVTATWFEDFELDQLNHLDFSRARNGKPICYVGQSSCFKTPD